MDNQAINDNAPLKGNEANVGSTEDAYEGDELIKEQVQEPETKIEQIIKPHKNKLLKELQMELYQSAKHFTIREEKQKTISKLRTVYTAAANQGLNSCQREDTPIQSR